jgi:hypothetical protein
MKVLICGSRDWTDPDLIREVLVPLVRLSKIGAGDLTVIHGGARGADSLAGTVARSLGIPVTEFPARWNSYGKRAGYLRNVEMAEQKPDIVIAFQKDNSTGTQMMIDIARERGIPVTVHTS